MNLCYYFSNTKSPTQYNLDKHLKKRSICKINNAVKANFNDKSLSLDETKTILLEYKHLLNALIERHQLNVAPLTYNITDESYKQVLANLPKGKHWILKPSMLNNGEGIFLFDTIEALYHHYHQNNRFAGMHVLQEYITPHLLNGHKYSFRFFIVITAFSGAYLYPQGYFNVAREKYQKSFSNINPHITNEHLNPDDSPNVHQIPTIKLPNFEPIFGAIKANLKCVLTAFEKEVALCYSGDKCFSLFGVDYLLDDNLTPWLLEFNHGPCFPTGSHPLQNVLYEPFWQDILDCFVLPMMNDSQIDYNEQFIKMV
jgi:Tubulin-tyrosine ligase family